MKTVIKGLANSVIGNLEKYFPDSKFINDTKIFDIQKFLENTKLDQPTYEIGLNEIANLCELYGESRKYGAKYAQPLIHSQNVKDEWPYFKLMVLHNFDATKDKEILSDVFRYYRNDFKNILDLLKIILLIPSNSASCERVNFKNNFYSSKN